MDITHGKAKEIAKEARRLHTEEGMSQESSISQAMRDIGGFKEPSLLPRERSLVTDQYIELTKIAVQAKLDEIAAKTARKMPDTNPLPPEPFEHARPAPKPTPATRAKPASAPVFRRSGFDTPQGRQDAALQEAEERRDEVADAIYGRK